MQLGTWIMVAVALLGPLQYGTGMTILNTMLETLSEDLGFDENVGGAVASAAFFLGAVISCLVSGPFEKMTGRFAQAWIGFISVVGALLCACSTDSKVCWGGPFEGCVAKMLVSGRLISGCAAGVSMVVSPKYLADISPPQIRGTLGASSQLCIATGVFFGIAIGLPYEFDDAFTAGVKWWRIMFLIVAVPAIAQAILGTLIGCKTANSQSEDCRSGQTVTAAESKQIELPALDSCIVKVDHGSAQTDSPEAGSRTTKKLDQIVPTKPATPGETLKLCFESRYRRSVILGIGAPVAGNLIGAAMVSAYSTTIFEDAGFEKPIIGSVAFGAMDIVGSAIAAFVFDKNGRITMAMFSYGGIAVSYLGLALSSLGSSVVANSLSVVFVLAFIFVFGTGCGPLIVAYAPEVVPREIADVVLGIGQSLSILTAVVQVLVFPAVLDSIGALATFLIFSVFSLASLVFLKIFMVETKGKSLEEVLAIIMR